MKYWFITLVFLSFYSFDLFADNLWNFSYAASGSFVSPARISSDDDINPKFRLLNNYQNNRFQFNYQSCDNLCYGLGFGIWNQSYVLGKYSYQNPQFLSYMSDTQFTYLSFELFKSVSKYSEGGLFAHLGQERIHISPETGLASESQNSSYVMFEAGPFLRLGLDTALILKRVYFESGAQLGIRLNNDIVLNNETIEARSMGKFTLLVYVGLGISF